MPPIIPRYRTTHGPEYLLGSWTHWDQEAPGIPTDITESHLA